MDREMDNYEPVVTTKPVRGREMIGTTIPAGILDTMRVVSGKAITGKDVTSAGENEVYYEGYANGKIYLIPDSNLEAMKDMINFTMRPRRSTRYKHQTSFELCEYIRAEERLNTLMEKMDDIANTDSEESEVESIKLAKKEEPEGEIGEGVKESAKLEVEKEEDEERGQEDTEEGPEGKIEECVMSSSQEIKDKEKISIKETESIASQKQKSNNYYLRFIISGHFKQDQTPIFIIQEYDGEIDLFKDQKSDFSSSKKEGKVDFFISGKFYTENILEENNHGKPVALQITSNKIPIKDENSQIYNYYFETIYSMKSVNIIVKGEFLRSKITRGITPFVTLSVKQKPISNPNLINEGIHNNNYSMYNDKSPTTVLIYKPKYNNPFSYNKEYNENEEIYSSSSTVTTESTESHTGSSENSYSTDSISTPQNQSRCNLFGEEKKVFEENNCIPVNKYKENHENNILKEQHALMGPMPERNDITNHCNKIDRVKTKSVLSFFKENTLYKTLITKINGGKESEKSTKYQPALNKKKKNMQRPTQSTDKNEKTNNAVTNNNAPKEINIKSKRNTPRPTPSTDKNEITNSAVTNNNTPKEMNRKSKRNTPRLTPSTDKNETTTNAVTNNNAPKEMNRKSKRNTPRPTPPTDKNETTTNAVTNNNAPKEMNTKSKRKSVGYSMKSKKHIKSV